MGFLSWLFGDGKSSDEQRANQISAEMGDALGRPMTELEIYKSGMTAFENGFDAEDNPFPYATPQFGTWEDGFQRQIHMKHRLEGLDDYYENPNNQY